MHPDDLYRAIGPSVSGPMPLIVLSEGWIEASEAVAQVRETIYRQADLTPIAEFDTDSLLDQRASRPTMTLIDGVVESITWPRIEISVGTDANGNPFMLLHGPEPDYRWRPFAKAVATIAGGVGVTTAFTMGAYPTPMPHTRPVRVSSTATNADLLTERDHTTGVIEVPVGIFAPIADELRRCGTDTMGLWAQVPYYVSTYSWPLASHGLLTNLRDVAGIEFDLAALEAQLADATAAVEMMLDETPSLRGVVESLEERFDELQQLEDRSQRLSTGDELERQLQQYLRNLDGD